MTVNHNLEDKTKALHSDGEWYIMSKEYYGDQFFAADYPFKSIIYHECRNHWKQHKDYVIWTPDVHYRVDIHEMTIPCTTCHSTCPEALVALWTLHNFDEIQAGK